MTPVGNKLSLDGGRVRNGQLVESETSPGVWFLSAELDGPGFEDKGDVATWATTSRFGSEAIYAVDELAKMQSGWRAVEEAEGISTDDAAVEKSRACVQG